MATSSKPKQDTTPEPVGIPLTGTKADKRLLQALKEDVAPEATPALQFLMDHAKIISSIVVGLVLIAIIVIGYQWNVKRNLEKAQIDISTALVSGQNEADIISNLEALIPELPDELQIAAYNEIVFRCELLKDYPKASEYWEKIYDQSSDSGFKVVAGLGWAKNLIVQNKLEDARSVLDNVAKQADVALLPQVEMEQAILAEKMGEPEKSLELYQSLLSRNSRFNKAFIATQIEQINKKLKTSAPAE